MKLKNIKKALVEISQLLSNNKQIVQLLYNDQANPLDIDINKNLNDLVSEGYITFYPPVDNYQDEKRNTFIVLLLDTVNLSTDVLRSNLTLYVTTDKDHILLNDNRNRLLELSDLIIDTLDGQKLSSAGEITISSMSHVMLSEFRAGYRISLSVKDQIADKVIL